MTDTLLCKECKHSFRTLSSLPYWGSGAEWRCRKAYVPATTEIDPVTGPKKVHESFERCASARGDWSKAVCGPNGKLWEPKNKRDLFKLIKKEVY